MPRASIFGPGEAMTTRLGREITPGIGKDAPTAADVARGSIRLTLGEHPVTLSAGADCAPTGSICGTETKAVAAAASASAGSSSKTFDLLLDVELPVSVSFGHAQVPLKDVLKLTTGSIVELSRSVSEPVDLVVNNCVIARGEVVVIEGNFGVRIQQVISR